MNQILLFLDSQNILIFIEIEKPSLKLFKKDGHQTAELIHAFQQVSDWLHECSKHKSAILDSLDLMPNEVMSVKGCVIAGRHDKQYNECFQRLLSRPLFGDVSFLILDELANSLLFISRDLTKELLH